MHARKTLLLIVIALALIMQSSPSMAEAQGLSVGMRVSVGFPAVGAFLIYELNDTLAVQLEGQYADWTYRHDNARVPIGAWITPKITDMLSVQAGALWVYRSYSHSYAKIPIWVQITPTGDGQWYPYLFLGTVFNTRYSDSGMILGGGVNVRRVFLEVYLQQGTHSELAGKVVFGFSIPVTGTDRKRRLLLF